MDEVSVKPHAHCCAVPSNCEIAGSGIDLEPYFIRLLNHASALRFNAVGLCLPAGFVAKLNRDIEVSHRLAARVVATWGERAAPTLLS